MCVFFPTHTHGLLSLLTEVEQRFSYSDIQSCFYTSTQMLCAYFVVLIHYTLIKLPEFQPALLKLEANILFKDSLLSY